jgi:hypothetical protein
MRAETNLAAGSMRRLMAQKMRYCLPNRQTRENESYTDKSMLTEITLRECARGG